MIKSVNFQFHNLDNYDNNASVSMIHSVPELKVSVEQAQQLGKADEEKLLSSRKLVLLVDLDQTLIHTTNNPNEQIQNKDVISFRLHSAHPQPYYTKLRPFTSKFLESIAKYYELHICTFGARLYAHKIAEILDTERKLFSHRILSRDECFDPQLKTGNLKALFPCGDSMVCIIDDREDVWNFQPNLISVKPYNYFRSTGDINSPNRQKDELLAKAAKVLSSKSNEDDEIRQEDEKESNKELDKDKEVNKDEESSKGDEVKEGGDDVKASETVNQRKDESTGDQSKEQSPDRTEDDDDDNDDYLLYLLEILKKIHRKFYKEYDEILKYSAEGEHIKIPDLKNLVPSIRREVLKGVNIVFTGLIPTKLEPEQSKLWIVAKQLGANVSKDVVKEGSPLEKTTHLIASNLNTFKVQEALKLKHVHVVNPIWLYVCSERWERVDERLYPIEKGDDFRNADKLKNKLSLSEQMFLNYDLVKLASLSKQSRQQEAKLQPLQIPSKSASKEPQSSKSSSSSPFPVYDSITGKLIRTNPPFVQSNVQQPTTSKDEQDEDSLLKNEEENLTPHSMVEFNPLAAFSDRDLKMMDEEVDDACSEEDEDSMDQMRLEREEEDYDDEENMLLCDYGDEPAVKKRKHDEVDCLSASSSSENTNLSFEDSNSNLDVELGGQLEKDFLN